ncbi:septum site-determining protein Ssd [Arthrobacter sp. JSM 101049]|uniref:septum site-determining protein Ssd n=1 Tax=Arthrobacter sp. JSM 101049 TaxID=929097 RepID=UPI0035669095
MDDVPAYLPPPPTAEVVGRPPADTAPWPGSGMPADARDGEPVGCLLVTRDDGLADHVALVAAACGAVLVVERYLPDRLPAGCTLALLGPDAADTDPAQRPVVPVVLVGFAPDRDGLWRAAARNPGVRVAILPEASAWLGEFLGEQGLHAGRGRVTLVAGASGGTGTTTLAVLAGLAGGRRGVRSLVVDADPHSNGIWPLLGRQRTIGVGWEDLTRSHGRIAPGHLAGILPDVAGTAVLTWTGGAPVPLPKATVNEVLAAARRTYDSVVVDVGRIAGLDETLAGLADSVVVVASAATPGPGQPLAPGGREGRAPWRLVVTGRLPAGADAARVASASGLELLAYVPPMPALAAAAAEGRLGTALVRPRTRRRIEWLVAWTLGSDTAAPDARQVAA